MKHLTIALALTGLCAASASFAIDCDDGPRTATGKAVAYTKGGAEIRQFSLDVTLDKIGENQCRTTTTVIPVDDPDSIQTTVCVATEITPSGLSSVQCDDGTYGTAISIGSNDTRQLFKTDGSFTVSGSATDDGGERRRNISTRFNSDGDIVAYIRETLTVVDM